MRQNPFSQRRVPPDDGPPPRIVTVVILIVVSIFMIAVQAIKLRTTFAHPWPLWMTDAEQWYDHLLAAVMWACLVVACGGYLRYRLRVAPAALTPVRAWPARRELRFVLYVLAIAQLAAFPIGVYKTFLAWHDSASPSGSNGGIEVFPIGGVLFPLIGIALIVYDRRRTQQAKREAGGLCLKCGYDLRASPKECPECGAVP